MIYVCIYMCILYVYIYIVLQYMYILAHLHLERLLEHNGGMYYIVDDLGHVQRNSRSWPEMCGTLIARR